MSTQSHHHENEEADQDERKRIEAAHKIQKLWKQRHNRAQEQYLTSDVRWKEAATHAKLKVDREAMDDGKNHPVERWKRAAFFATQLRDGNSMLKPKKNEQDVPEDVKKHLETQHWLELVDGKHRYGSNLKYYHKRWLDEDTQDNFFRWLDQGEGKSLSLDECPREQLEKERIQYLSAEQRLNYLAIIDNKGKLRWARNNELVDTTPGHWKDSGNGGGIIPDDLPERPAQSRTSFDSASSSSLSSSSASVNSDNAMHYLDPPKGKYPWTRAFRRYFTPKGIFNRLLRKTVQRNTWIWVTDRYYNIFLGIKDTGTFQHSTFLAGGLVTSAGLISVKNGMVHTLSPLSGHYRTTVGHFHKFLDVLEDRGLDMRKVKVSKAEAALWGIEHLGKIKKKEGELKKKGKERAVEIGQDIAMKMPMVDSSWKREVIEGRRKKKEAQNHDDLEASKESKPSGSTVAERNGASEGRQAESEEKELNDRPNGTEKSKEEKVSKDGLADQGEEKSPEVVEESKENDVVPPASPERKEEDSKEVEIAEQRSTTAPDGVKEGEN